MRLANFDIVSHAGVVLPLQVYRVAALRKLKRKAGVTAYFKPVNPSAESDQDAKSKSEENEVQTPSNSMMGSMPPNLDPLKDQFEENLSIKRRHLSLFTLNSGDS